MKNVGKMIDLKRDKSEGKPPEVTAASHEGPDYPYGLCLSLDHETLKKLNLSDEAEVGDTLHLFALAKVTASHKTETEAGGKRAHIELQITHIALEDEDGENKSADKKMSGRYGADVDEGED